MLNHLRMVKVTKSPNNKIERFFDENKYWIPPFNFFYLSKKIISYSIGNWARRTFNILPAIDMFDSPKSIIEVDKMRNLANEYNGDCQINTLAIKINKKIEMDTIEIIPKDINKESVYIINFVGNADCYEQNIEYMIKNSEDKNCVNIGFNYPGVARSKGKPNSINEIIDASICQVQRLIDKGVNPEKIILRGHSLGGGISLNVASYYHKIGIKVNVFNDRSFSLVSFNPTATELEANNRNKGGSIPKIISWLKYYLLIRPATILTGWEMDAKSAYNQIPEKNKDYLFVHTKKKERFEYFDDFKIPYYNSLHISQKSKRKEFLILIDKISEEINCIFDKGKNTKQLVEYLNKLDINKNNFKPDSKNKSVEILALIKGNITKKENSIKENILYNLKELRDLLKYDHKFIIDYEKMFEDLHNIDIIKKRYNEKCDREILDKKAPRHENYKSIHPDEKAYLEWLELGFLINEKNIIVTKEQIKELTKKMKAHVMPLEYLKTRDEFKEVKMNGKEYYEKFIDRVKEPSDPKINLRAI